MVSFLILFLLSMIPVRFSLTAPVGVQGQGQGDRRLACDVVKHHELGRPLLVPEEFAGRQVDVHAVDAVWRGDLSQGRCNPGIVIGKKLTGLVENGIERGHGIEKVGVRHLLGKLIEPQGSGLDRMGINRASHLRAIAVQAAMKVLEPYGEAGVVDGLEVNGGASSVTWWPMSSSVLAVARTASATSGSTGASIRGAAEKASFRGLAGPSK